MFYMGGQEVTKTIRKKHQSKNCQISMVLFMFLQMEIMTAGMLTVI